MIYLLRDLCRNILIDRIYTRTCMYVVYGYSFRISSEAIFSHKADSPAFEGFPTLTESQNDTGRWVCLSGMNFMEHNRYSRTTNTIQIFVQNYEVTMSTVSGFTSRTIATNHSYLLSSVRYNRCTVQFTSVYMYYFYRSV